MTDSTRVQAGSTRRHALLVVDLQQGFSRAGEACLAAPLAAEATRRGVVDVAADVQSAALQAGVPVIQTRLAFDATYFTRSNRTARFDRYPADRLLNYEDASAQIVPELCSPDAVLVTKSCVDPLVGTALPAMLAANRVTDLLVGGVATNLAVESAARHCADLGIQVWIVEDMCASFSSEMHELAVTHTLPLFAEIFSSKEAMSLFASVAVPS